jgi:hypothetical protein
MRGRIGALPASALGAAVAGIVGCWSGGYFETTWGWLTLVLFWTAALVLVLAASPSLTRGEALFSAALGALLVWTLLSVFWASSADEPVREAERLLVYVAVALAAPLLVPRSRHTQLLGGALAGITAVAAVALTTRLFPDHLPTAEDIDGYRLAEPIGYWNALGLFSALGVLLSLGFVAYARSATGRALAGAALVVLAPTLYFTFSRGAWLALGVGLLTTVALDPRRLRSVTSTLVAAPAPILAVWLASRSPALTQLDTTLDAASEQGRRLAFAILALCLLNAALVRWLVLLSQRWRLPRRAARAVGLALLGLAGLALIGAFARFGGPVKIAHRLDAEFRAPPPKTEGDLNARLFNLSSPGRYQQWRVAWQMVEEHPVLGAGAGSYERYWHRDRPVPGKIRDAHSLYLEMLAELGPAGLGLLLLALGVPGAAAVKARRRPLVPAAGGAYVAYLVHAGVDWDWEMPAVTLTALLCAVAILAAGRPDEVRPLSRAVRGGLLVMSVPFVALAFAGLAGNGALAASRSADDRATAEAEARKAMRWAPWSANAIEQLGEVQFEYGDLNAARQSFRRAIAKNPQDWDLWFDLAIASDGPTLREAVARATYLNPLDPELAALRHALELQDRPATTGDVNAP